MAIVRSEKSGKFFDRDTFSALYGAGNASEPAEQRYAALAERFERVFHAQPAEFFSSPGRIEVAGNHTDHNRGKVLVAAITVDTLAAAARTDDGVIVISSEGYPDMTVDVDRLAKDKREEGTSLAAVKGVAQGFLDRGYRVGGFRAAMTSSVFRGAGVSSSASFELLVAEILNVYYNGGSIPAMQKAEIGQFAENVYFGKPCGLLDQAGIALGGLSAIDFGDPAHPEAESLSPDFSGYSLVLTNTGGDHANLTAAYASIREDMHAVAACFGKETLREVDESAFYERYPELVKRLPGRSLLRAVHFFEENRRVERCLDALKRGDMPAFLAGINASGDSSWELLQNLYVPGDAAQLIPAALALTRRLLDGEGACRVHGGGFAGTVLAFVPEGKLSRYLSEMKRAYGDGNVFRTEVRASGACRVQ